MLKLHIIELKKAINCNHGVFHIQGVICDPLSEMAVNDCSIHDAERLGMRVK